MYQTNQELPQNLQQKKKPHNILMCVIYFISMMILTSVPMMILMVNELNKGGNPSEIDQNLINSALVYGMDLGYAVLAITAALLYHRVIKDEFKKNTSIWSFIATIGVEYIIFFIVNCASSILMAYLKGSDATTENQQGVEMGYDAVMPIPAKILYFLSIMIIAPFVEEIIFRFIFQNWVERQCLKLMGAKSSAVIAVLCSSFLFGFIHTFAISLDLIIYMSMGIVLGIIYRRKKNLSHSIGTHALNNTISVCISMLSRMLGV